MASPPGSRVNTQYRGKRLLDGIKQVSHGLPESLSDGASNVLAEPRRAHRLTVAPDATRPALGDVVGAAQRHCAPEGVGGVAIEEREGWRLGQAGRRDAHAGCDASQNRGPPGRRLRSRITQNAADEKVGQRRDVGTTLRARIEGTRRRWSASTPTAEPPSHTDRRWLRTRPARSRRRAPRSTGGREPATRFRPSRRSQQRLADRVRGCRYFKS